MFVSFLALALPRFNRTTSAQLVATTAAGPISVVSRSDPEVGVTLQAQAPDSWLWHWADNTQRVAIQHAKSRLWLSSATTPRHRWPARLTMVAAPDASWQVQAHGKDGCRLLYHTEQSTLALDFYSTMAPELYFWRPLDESSNQRWHLRSDPTSKPPPPPPPAATYTELLSALSRLPYRDYRDGLSPDGLPTQSNQIQVVSRGDADRQATIGRMASETSPFLHARTLRLVEGFIQWKQQAGTSVERPLYARLDARQLITRLLSNRPLMFMDASDQYQLRTGERGVGKDLFPKVGTVAEAPPLVLRDYLSYDEMEVAALLGVAVPTYLINDGARDNRGVVGAAGSFEEEAVIVDMVGCRFERTQLMEWRHMVVTPEQNTPANGYGDRSDPQFMRNGMLDLFATLYLGDSNLVEGTAAPTFPSYAQAVEAQRRNASWWVHPDVGTSVPHTALLNVGVFRARYLLQASAYLHECSARGAARGGGGGAYCSVAEAFITEPWWLVARAQALWLMQAFRDALSPPARYPGIRVLDFPKYDRGFFETVWGGQAEVRVGEITVRNTQSREPGALLTGADAGLLVVHQFAGDGERYCREPRDCPCVVGKCPLVSLHCAMA